MYRFFVMVCLKGCKVTGLCKLKWQYLWLHARSQVFLINGVVGPIARAKPTTSAGFAIHNHIKLYGPHFIAFGLVGNFCKTEFFH